MYRSPGINETSAYLIRTIDENLGYEVYKIVISVRDRNQLSQNWKKAIIIPIS
jgi:hypothetical protein